MDFIQIGPHAHDTYTLTVTLTAATGVETLVADHTAPLWLSYKLFGVLVQTDQFPVGGQFAPIRDVFRLRGALEDVHAHLSSLSKVEVYLCSPGRVWAAAQLPVQTLVAPTPSPRDLDPEFVGAEATGGFLLRAMGGPTAAAVVAVPDDADAESDRPAVQGMVELARHCGVPPPDAAPVASSKAVQALRQDLDGAQQEVVTLRAQLAAASATCDVRERELADLTRRLRVCEEDAARGVQEVRRELAGAQEAAAARAREAEELRDR